MEMRILETVIASKATQSLLFRLSGPYNPVYPVNPVKNSGSFPGSFYSLLITH